MHGWRNDGMPLPNCYCSRPFSTTSWRNSSSSVVARISPIYVPKHAVLYWQLLKRELKRAPPEDVGALKSWQSRVTWRPRVPFAAEVVQELFLRSIEEGMKAAGDYWYLYPLGWRPHSSRFLGTSPPECVVARPCQNV